MADYLVDRLGYPKDQALAASKPLLRVTSSEKPDVVLDFLRHRDGLSLPQLRCFIRCRPSILIADAPSNLLPKLSLFHSLLFDVGTSPDDPPQVALPPAAARNLILSLSDLRSGDRPFEDNCTLVDSHDLLSSLALSNF